MRQTIAAIAILLTPGLLATGLSQRPEQVREFSTASSLDQSPGPTASVALADLDADGDLDVVLAKGRHDGGVDRLLLNNGDGTFAGRDFGTLDDASYSATPADVDGDGDLDIVVSNDLDRGRIYLNDGRANFTLGSEWGDPDWPTRNATVADLNGDGTNDVVIGYGTTMCDRASVLFNDGTGRAFRHVRFGDKTSAMYGLAIGDVDGDGYADIVAARNNQLTLVLFNRPGLGVDTVFASAELTTPMLINMALYEPKPFDPRRPFLGSWHGQASRLLDCRSDVDLELRGLTPGPRSVGSAIESSNGVAYCQGGLRLQEVLSGNVIRLAYRRRLGDCPDVIVELTLLDEHRLRSESWQEGRERNRTVAILERKR